MDNEVLEKAYRRYKRVIPGHSVILVGYTCLIFFCVQNILFISTPLFVLLIYSGGMNVHNFGTVLVSVDWMTCGCSVIQYMQIKGWYSNKLLTDVKWALQLYTEAPYQLVYCDQWRI